MNSGQQFCRITGDAKIEKLKERIWKIQLNVGSLENVLKVLVRIGGEFQKSQDQRDSMILESLTFYAVVEYTKCFNSDFSDTLDPSIFSTDG